MSRKFSVLLSGLLTRPLCCPPVVHRQRRRQAPQKHQVAQKHPMQQERAS